MRTALVLAGHGSHLSPQTASLIWSHVDALRRLQVADEVTATFWKESPSFARVLDTLTADDITIIPIFTAQGFFTRAVIPAELRLAGAFTSAAGRTVRYARTLSEHPRLAQVVRERVIAGLRAANVSGEHAAVALIGHSTKRNPDSRQATETQAELLRQAGIAAEVAALYLDDTPEIEAIFTLTDAPIIVAVPFFVALGSHVTQDVPARLGLPMGATRGHIQGRDVIYTDPVGVDDSLGQVILDLALEAGAPIHSPVPTEAAWIGFPTAGHAEFLRFAASIFATRDSFSLGELHITPTGVCHVDDSGIPNLLPLIAPHQLRQHVRETPHFRPLATSCDLPRGWRSPLRELETLPAVIETIYPGLIADWAAACNGTLHIADLAQVTARQVGMFRQLAHLNTTAQHELIDQTCGNCVLHPSWFDGTTNDHPCPEPCNLWMSEALTQLVGAEVQE